MLRLSYAFVFALMTLVNYDSVIVLGQDPCAAEDTALDACLTAAGLNDVFKGACDTCIAAADFAASLVSTDQSACTQADIAACIAFGVCASTACGDCLDEVEAKGLCEIDAERTANGGTCTPADCTTPEEPTDAPVDMTTTDAPADMTTTDAPADMTPSEAPADMAPTDAPVDTTPTDAPSGSTRSSVFTVTGSLMIMMIVTWC